MSETIAVTITAVVGTYALFAIIFASYLQDQAKRHLNPEKRREYARLFFKAPLWPVMVLSEWRRLIKKMRETAK